MDSNEKSSIGILCLAFPTKKKTILVCQKPDKENKETLNQDHARSHWFVYFIVILISIQHLLSLNSLPGSAKVFVFALPNQELIIVDYSFNYIIEPFALFF